MAENEAVGLDRASIVERLREEPGLRPADIARVFGVHPSTAEYHLRRLDRVGRVARVRVGRELHHYVVGEGICRKGREVHARLTPAGRAVLRFGLDRRVFPRGCVVDLGFSSSAVRWAIDRFEALGVVERLAWGVYELAAGWRGCVASALREEACSRCLARGPFAGQGVRQQRRATRSPSPRGRMDASRSR